MSVSFFKLIRTILNSFLFLLLGKISSNEKSNDDGMTVFNKLLAQVQETTTKPHSVIDSAPTEQDILANLLGKHMKIDAQKSHTNHSRKYICDLITGAIACLKDNCYLQSNIIRNRFNKTPCLNFYNNKTIKCINKISNNTIK